MTASRQRWIVPAWLGVVAWPSAAIAEAPEPSDKVEEVLEELFVGEPVYPQDALELQITSDLGAVRAGDTTAASVGLTIELGLTDRLQLELRAPFEWMSTGDQQVRGVGNTGFEALYNAYSDRARGRAFSAGIGVSFPPPSDAGEDAWAIEAFAVGYQVLGRVHVNLVVGAELALPRGPGAERELSPSAALSLFVPVGRWVPVLELGAELGDDCSAVLAAGVQWHPAGELELGAAARIGLDDRSIGGFALATIEFELAGD